jgi:hypothetical protein
MTGLRLVEQDLPDRVTEHHVAIADTLDRRPEDDLVWQGSREMSAAVAAEIAVVATVLALRGLGTTMTVDPAGDEVRVTLRLG